MEKLCQRSNQQINQSIHHALGPFWRNSAKERLKNKEKDSEVADKVLICKKWFSNQELVRFVNQRWKSKITKLKHSLQCKITGVYCRWFCISDLEFWFRQLWTVTAFLNLILHFAFCILIFQRCSERCFRLSDSLFELYRTSEPEFLRYSHFVYLETNATDQVYVRHLKDAQKLARAILLFTNGPLTRHLLVKITVIIFHLFLFSIFTIFFISILCF